VNPARAEYERIACWYDAAVVQGLTRSRGQTREWLELVNSSADFLAGLHRGDVAMMRTAVSVTVLRAWPDAMDIPPRVWQHLRELGVKVRR
jgi:hypothetical protein